MLFSVFGLRVESDFSLVLHTHEPSSESQDVEIVRQPLARRDLPYSPYGLAVSSQQPLALALDFPGHARMELTATRVTYDTDAGVCEGDLRHLILDWALPLVLMLRGTPALHAAAVRGSTAAGATLLCGLSGAGKSTTSFVLSQRRHQKIADDISAIALDDHGVSVEPGLSHSKLMVDALDRLALDCNTLLPVLHKAEKFVVPSTDTSIRRQPVMEIIELVCESNAALSMKELRGVEKVGVLDRHTAGTTVMGEVGLRGMHMAWLSRMAMAVPVYRLTRPTERDTTEDIALLLEAHWAKQARAG